MAGARGAARRKLVGRLLGPRNRRRGAGAQRLLPPWATLVRGVAVALGVGVVALAWPAVRDAVARHPYFAVREVVVSRMSVELVFRARVLTRDSAGCEPTKALSGRFPFFDNQGSSDRVISSARCLRRIRCLPVVRSRRTARRFAPREKYYVGASHFVF